jgi:hypothetical protein
MCGNTGLRVNLQNKTLFKLTLRKYLLTHVFYSVEEFLKVIQIHNFIISNTIIHTLCFYILTQLTLYTFHVEVVYIYFIVACFIMLLLLRTSDDVV